MTSHAVTPDSQPELGATPARMRVAVARTGRAYAMACEYLPRVFGKHSATTEALRMRVEAFRSASALELPSRAARLYDLAIWRARVAMEIETESLEAANLRPCLATILAECERISRAPSSSRAAAA